MCSRTYHHINPLWSELLFSVEEVWLARASGFMHSVGKHLPRATLLEGVGEGLPPPVGIWVAVCAQEPSQALKLSHSTSSTSTLMSSSVGIRGGRNYRNTPDLQSLGLQLSPSSRRRISCTRISLNI